MQTADDRERAQALLRDGAPEFWRALAEATTRATAAPDVMALSTLRKRALARGVDDPTAPKPLRFAMVGGYSLYPLRELVEHCLWAAGYSVAGSFFVGDYDNYVHELLHPDSELSRFGPEVVFVIPAGRRCRYDGALAADRPAQEAAAREIVQHLLDLCRPVHERTAAEVILANFLLPAGIDPGSYRTRSLGSSWTFRKFVNLELGLAAPPWLHICDLEFLAYRHGGVRAADPQGWFATKQLCAPDMMVEVAREAAHLTGGLWSSPKKVLALDLDETLWGGVIGDVGIEGIELGDTSPRGEAFKAFQQFVASLKERGVLLAVCSKNNPETAAEAFEKHPEMVLRLSDLVGFKASWGPKSESLRELAAELALGLDAFVFVDDNPAEIDIVRQFAPEVTAIQLGPDPADYVRQLQDARLFEPRHITAEDGERTAQYRREAERRDVLARATDLPAYLDSLLMEATLREFIALDVPRIAQLINKSNQFNLTTRRRTESEVEGVMANPAYAAFTIRLADRFGDHGLIAVVILAIDGEVAEVDTWLMSCRVLERQVEDVTVNEVMRLATLRGCHRVVGRYTRTAKNAMVRDLYQRVGFQLIEETGDQRVFVAHPADYRPRPHHVTIVRRAYDAG